MSIWRAAFLASKIMALFFLAQTIISVEPIIRAGYAGGAELFIVPGILAASAFVLWSFADVIAHRIARAASDWGADFAARHDLPLLEPEELTNEDGEGRERTRTFARVNLGVAVLGVIMFILLLSLLISSFRGPALPYRNFGLGSDPFPFASLSAIVVFGVGATWMLRALRRASHARRSGRWGDFPAHRAD